jgi:purine-binding chemotaxis protein CheW
MDFLSIRKKARERAEAKEAAQPEGALPAELPAAAPAPAAPPPLAEDAAPRAPASTREPAPVAEARAEPAPDGRSERRRARGDEPVLTEADLIEGALQARFQGLAPSADGRFATWRPGSGPPPVEPDHRSFMVPAERAEPPPPAAPAPLAKVAARRPQEPEAEHPPAHVILYEPSAVAPRAAPLPAVARDPLEGFFYRPDEEAALVPAIGGMMDEEPVPRAPERNDEYLTFLLGKEEYGVAIGMVREVLRAPAITEVPRAPAHILGVITVRGEVVAVLDARARLGLSGEPAAGGRIVIVEAGDGSIGLLVDAVSSVVRLPAGSIEPCPQGVASAASDCVTGIGRWRDRLFMVVDSTRLMGHRPRGEER